jgi:hypothetical protein
MGHSLTPVAFFSDEITLIPHTATEASHIGRPVSIREFARGGPVSLYKRDDNGEYVVSRYKHNTFMEGPEA